MPITRNTAYRAVGPVSYTTWRDTITSFGGRAELASRAAYDAAGTKSGVLLRILIQESSCDTDYRANSKANNNPYNIRVKDRSNEDNPKGYIKYANLVAATKAAADRIDGADGFFDGPNPYASCVTISDLLYTYAPPPWNDTEGLITKMVNQLNAWLPNWSPPVTTPSTPEEPIEEESPMATYTYTNGVAPPWVDYKVAESAKYAGYIDAAQHFIAAVVWHSAYGNLVGTTGWYQDGHALTDTMVGNSLDGAALDGQIRRFNDAYGGRYAWSSGPVDNPIDDAAKFLEIFGPNKEVVNMYTTAMERSCGSTVATNPVTEKERASRVWWTAYHANKYGEYLYKETGQHQFTCDTFPLIPSQNNRSFIIYHGEINADKRTSCPDQFVRADIDREIADIKALLAKWQKGTATNPDPVPVDPPVDTPNAYAPVRPIPGLVKYAGMDTDKIPAVVTDGGKKYTFVWDRVKALRQVPRRQTAENDALTIGQDIEKGLEFAVSWLFHTDDGTDWYVTPYWTRVRVSDTERIKDAA